MAFCRRVSCRLATNRLVNTRMTAPTLENKELKNVNVYVLWSQPIISTDSGWATVFPFDFVIWFAPNRDMFKEKQAWRRYGRYAISS
jgi:hypothetical protein